MHPCTQLGYSVDITFRLRELKLWPGILLLTPIRSLPVFYLLQFYHNKVIPTVLCILISKISTEVKDFIFSTLLEGEGRNFFQLYPTNMLPFHPSTAEHPTPIPNTVKGVGTIVNLHCRGRSAHRYAAHSSCWVLKGSSHIILFRD